MSTTVTIQITEHRGLFPSAAKQTEITVTRATKAQAIAEAIAMTAAAHRPEMERAWADLVAQVGPLLEAYRESRAAAAPAEGTEDDGPTAG